MVVLSLDIRRSTSGDSLQKWASWHHCTFSTQKRYSAVKLAPTTTINIATSSIQIRVRTDSPAEQRLGVLFVFSAAATASDPCIIPAGKATLPNVVCDFRCKWLPVWLKLVAYLASCAGMDELSADLISYIIAKLDQRTAVRFTCTCQLYRQLVHDTFLITLSITDRTTPAMISSMLPVWRISTVVFRCKDVSMIYNCAQRICASPNNNRLREIRSDFRSRPSELEGHRVLSGFYSIRNQIRILSFSCTHGLVPLDADFLAANFSNLVQIQFNGVQSLPHNLTHALQAFSIRAVTIRWGGYGKASGYAQALQQMRFLQDLTIVASPDDISRLCLSKLSHFSALRSLTLSALGHCRPADENIETCTTLRALYMLDDAVRFFDVHLSVYVLLSRNPSIVECAILVDSDASAKKIEKTAFDVCNRAFASYTDAKVIGRYARQFSPYPDRIGQIMISSTRTLADINLKYQRTGCLKFACDGADHEHCF